MKACAGDLVLFCAMCLQPCYFVSNSLGANIAIGSFGVTRKNGSIDCYYISHFLRLITSVYDFSAFTHMYYRKGSSLVLLNETCLTVIIAFQFRFFSPQYESEEQLLLELAIHRRAN